MPRIPRAVRVVFRASLRGRPASARRRHVVLYVWASMTCRRTAVYRRVVRDDSDVCGLGFAAARGIEVWGFEPPFVSMPSFRFAIDTISLSLSLSLSLLDA